MSKDTQMIVQSILNQIAIASNLENAYNMVARVANAGGDKVPTYEELRKELGVD